MKVLDRYLIRELFLPIFYITVTLIFLILIADVFDHLDDFLRNHTPPLVILRYYWSLTPYTFFQIIPWAAWLGTLFLLATLGFHNEITAMKVVGLKITTIIRPVLFIGFLIGIISFLISDRVVPKTYRTAKELRQVYIEKSKERKDEKLFKNVTYYADANRHYYFGTFAPAKGVVENVFVLWFDTDQGNAKKKMTAKKGIWDKHVWRFKNVREYQTDTQGRILGEAFYFPEKVYPEINVTPQDLVSVSSDSAFLTYHELKKLAKLLRVNGAYDYREKVDMYSRLALPWQGLVMMMIAVPLLAKTASRKGIALNLLFCIVLIFAYHVTGAVGLAMGKAGKLFPFVSAWASNMIFAIGALFFLEKANY